MLFMLGVVPLWGRGGARGDDTDFSIAWSWDDGQSIRARPQPWGFIESPHSPETTPAGRQRIEPL